ncbi:hypothetical protein M422DRAFT_268208, partial [Sphaerobolus stellatus SS14]
MPLTLSNVHEDYDIKSPPPHPGQSWTRFVCVSDTHSRAYDVPPGDVLLHAGDLSMRGSLGALQKTVKWIKTLPHPVKILIAGNHDVCLDKDLMGQFDPREGKMLQDAIDLVRGEEAQKSGLHYLEYEATSFVCRGRKWKVFGSPAAPFYNYEGAFQYTDEDGAY